MVLHSCSSSRSYHPGSLRRTIREPEMEDGVDRPVRFGLVWKVFDMVALRGLDHRVPILGPSASYPVALYSGVSGQSFMLIATEVIQPRARKGCGNLPPLGSVGCKKKGVPSRQCNAGFELFPPMPECSFTEQRTSFLFGRLIANH